MQAQHFADGVLGGLPRIEAGVRILEDDLDLPAAPAPFARRARRAGAVPPARGDRAVRAALQADDHSRDRRLARS